MEGTRADRVIAGAAKLYSGDDLCRWVEKQISGGVRVAGIEQAVDCLSRYVKRHAEQITRGSIKSLVSTLESYREINAIMNNPLAEKIGVAVKAMGSAEVLKRCLAEAPVEKENRPEAFYLPKVYHYVRPHATPFHAQAWNGGGFGPH